MHGCNEDTIGMGLAKNTEMDVSPCCPPAFLLRRLTRLARVEFPAHRIGGIGRFDICLGFSCIRCATFYGETGSI